MEENKIKANFKYALENNEVQKFLEGKGSYGAATHQMEINLLLTDTTNVLLKGIYAQYNEGNENDTIGNIFEITLIKMLDSNEIMNIFSVSMYLLSQCRLEQRGRSPFVLNKDNIIQKLLIKISENEKELKYYRNEELNTDINILEHINRIKRNLKRECNIDIDTIHKK